MRPDHELYEIEPHEWTREEVFQHLKKTFDDACRVFPEIMEPFAVLAADVTDEQEAKALMWQALRETIRLRRPLPYELPADMPVEQAGREVVNG